FRFHVDDLAFCCARIDAPAADKILFHVSLGIVNRRFEIEERVIRRIQLITKCQGLPLNLEWVTGVPAAYDPLGALSANAIIFTAIKTETHCLACRELSHNLGKAHGLF